MRKPGRKVFSGKEVVKILVKHFGFAIAGQRGSHIKCHRKVGGRTITTVVPQHKELSPGTLAGVLELAELDKEEFQQAVN